jgi:hypothetical protein
MIKKESAHSDWLKERKKQAAKNYADRKITNE